MLNLFKFWFYKILKIFKIMKFFIKSAEIVFTLIQDVDNFVTYLK